MGKVCVKKPSGSVVTGKEEMCAFHCPLQGIPFIDLQCWPDTLNATLLNYNQIAVCGSKLHMLSKIVVLLFVFIYLLSWTTYQ